MKKINLLLYSMLLFSVLFFQEIQAQSNLKLNLDAGLTYTSVDYNLSNRVDSEYNNRWGFVGNLTLEYQFYNSFFIGGGLSFSQKNFQFDRTGSRDGWYTKYNNNYIGIPVSIGAYLINNPFKEKGMWIKVAGGAYTNYLLSINREGQYPVFFELGIDGEFPISEKIKEKYDFDKNENQLNRIDYGIHGQFQVGYNFGKLGIYGSYTYQYGLAEFQKSNVNNRNMYFDASMFTIGVSHNF